MAVFGFAQKPDKFGAGSFRFGAAPIKGGVVPPAGFVFLVDDDGAYLTDADGYYLLEAE